MIDWISLYASLREMCNDSFLAKGEGRTREIFPSGTLNKKSFQLFTHPLQSNFNCIYSIYFVACTISCLSNCNCKVELNFIVSCMYCDEVITNVCLGRSHFTLNGPFLPRVSILHREYARNKLLIIDSLKCQPSPRSNPPMGRGSD